MQVLILLAGMAERLRPLTLNQPKCLIEIDGQTFLERMITNILAYGITDINFITGFQVDKIKKFLKTHFPNQIFNFYHNDRYFETNNCYSLWLGKHLIHDDFLLFDADIIFDYRILALLINSPYKNSLAVRTTSDMGEEEMKVEVDLHNKIRAINKTMLPKSAIGESIGIERFSKDLAMHLFNKLEENILQKKLVNDFYEKSFEDIIQEGAEIMAIDVKELKCAEVDFIEDIHYVENNILPHIKQAIST